jgi:hypothetical protein
MGFKLLTRQSAILANLVIRYKIGAISNNYDMGNADEANLADGRGFI